MGQQFRRECQEVERKITEAKDALERVVEAEEQIAELMNELSQDGRVSAVNSLR